MHYILFLELDCQFNHKLAGSLLWSYNNTIQRRTFDRRLKTMSTDIKERILAMGYLFVTAECMSGPSITPTDSTLIKAKGSVWHKSSIEKE